MTKAGTAEFAVVAESWFDGERRHGEPATFLVQDGRVAEATSGDHGAALAKRGLAVVRGGFLMPGLVDAHVHLFLDGALIDPKLRSGGLGNNAPLNQSCPTPGTSRLPLGRAMARARRRYFRG